MEQGRCSFHPRFPLNILMENKERSANSWARAHSIYSLGVFIRNTWCGKFTVIYQFSGNGAQCVQSQPSPYVILYHATLKNTYAYILIRKKLYPLLKIWYILLNLGCGGLGFTHERYVIRCVCARLRRYFG